MISMFFCLPSLPPLVGLLALWVLSSASRTAMRRAEAAATELIEDVRTLSTRDAAERIPTILGSQGTPFARALAAALTVPWTTAESLEALVEAKLWEVVKRPTPAERLAGVVAGLLGAYAGLILLMAGSALSEVFRDPSVCGVIAFAAAIPLLATAWAIRSTLALHRERRQLAERQRAMIVGAILGTSGSRRPSSGEAQ